MKYKKWLIIIPLILVGVAAVLWLSRSTQSDAASTNAMHTVKKGPMLISVTESGELKALKEISINCEVNGQNQVIFLVDEGKEVKKGDLLVEFDSADLKSRINRQEIEYQSAMSSYNQAKENLEIRKSLNTTEITTAKLNLNFAILELKKFKEGQWPLDIKQQKSKIALAQDELIRAKDRLNWTTTLQEKGYATRSELESDSLSVKRKELEIEQEQEKLKLMETYDFPQKLEKLQADVEKATQELDRVKRKAKAELSQSMSDLRAKEANMKNHEDELKDMRDQLEKMKIFAPQDGLVVYHKSRWSEAIQVGGTVKNRQTLMTLPDISTLTAEIKVHESRIGQIVVGQLAYVTLDIMPDRRFKGTVNRAAPMPDPSSWWNPGLKEYSVQVIIDDQLPADVKPGLSAKAQIIIDKLDDVLNVPVQAVTTQKRVPVCYVKKGGTFKVVPVQPGAYNDTSVAVKEGLTEGDEIMLDPPSTEEALTLGLAIVDPADVKAAEVRRPEPGTKPMMKGATPAINKGTRPKRPKKR